MKIEEIKKAISWAYHGEEQETIDSDIGPVDPQILQAVVDLLITIGADYDTVHDWSKKINK